MPLCVSLCECECAYTYVSARVWTSMYLCGISHLKVCCVFVVVVVVWWVRVCESVCVCAYVCIRQSLPLQSLQTPSLYLSSPPPLLRPPSYGSHRWERQEKWNNRDERHSSGVFRSPMPWVFSLPPAPSSQLHDFLHPPMTAPICVCVSPAASLCLFHSLNSAPRAETVCSLIMSTELACLRPPLSLWQAPIVFAKYANDSVCVHLSWPGSRFPPPSVSPI